jgi:hypothetical protein
MNAPLSACWRADDARAIFVTEALEGDDAIFLATHTPIEGFDVGGTHVGEFAGTKEDAVLETLSNPVRQHAFCVVQGEPGSGKSHLIRWLSVNWPCVSDIKLLLRRADGSLEGALRQLKERLPPEFSKLFDNLGQRQNAAFQGRANIFLSTLANTLEPGHFDVPLVDDDWCRKYAPAELLAHPEIKSKWKSPSRILRLLEGAGGERNSATASFDLYDIEELADLCSPLLGSPSIAHARELARRLDREADVIRAYRQQDWLAHELAAEHPEQVQTSLKLADVLNRRRNEAIQNVLGVSASRLKTLFREVREALAERDQRLVLLLEDITSWQGLDEGLIDVLVFNAAAKGDHDARKVCPLISVVGVTPTYYEWLAGNYRQRITHVVRLGQSIGGLEDVATLREEDAPRKFAVRYLAAARAGPAALDRWLKSVQAGKDAPPPNPCDTCTRQSGCFDVFHHEDGIGLFPFTPRAFDRFFDALKENDNGQTWKTPRGILQAILYPSLSQPDSLAAGTYPGALVEPDVLRPERRSNLALSNRLEQIVVNRINAPQEQARMRRVLSYWADPERADTTMANGELAFAGTRRAVFEAFGLTWIGAGEATDGAAALAEPVAMPEPILPEPAEPEPDESASGSASSRPRALKTSQPIVIPPKPKRLTQTKSQLEQLREQLRAWIATGTMDNPSRWNDLLYRLIASLDARKLGVPSALVNRIITPEMVKMQGSTSGSRDYLTIGAAPWVRNGFEAYLALRQDTGMTVADAAFHRHNLATMMRHLERSAVAYLDRRIPQMAEAARWSPVATFAQILLARAWMRGVVATDAPIPDQIRAVLEDEANSESEFSARSTPWQEWLNATSKVHERLRTDIRSMVGLAIGDGEGGAPLTDASQLAGAVVRFRETGRFDPVPETDGALPEPFRRARELAELWRDRRTLIERTEASQITNRSQTLSLLLRSKSVATHLDRLDRCITGIAELLPQVSTDRVIAWRQAYGRLKPKLEQGAGARVEDLICSIEAEEMPVKLPIRLGWLARAPVRDLDDFLSTAQLGEKVVEALREHACDCVREAGGTGSLAQIKAIGGSIKAAVADRPAAIATE